MYIPINLNFIVILSLCCFIFNYFLFLFPFYSFFVYKNTAAISHRCSSCFYHEIILFLCRYRLDDMHTYKKQNKYRKEYCKPKMAGNPVWKRRLRCIHLINYSFSFQFNLKNIRIYIK